jgi:hypothetical protein
MLHRKVHYQIITRRRKTVHLSLGFLQDYVVCYLKIPIFTSLRSNFVDLKSVTHRTKKDTQLINNPVMNLCLDRAR